MEENLNIARNIVQQCCYFMQVKDIQAILNSLSTEISIQFPDINTLTGKEQVRLFYEQLFQVADYNFELNITDEKVVSDLFFINGNIHRTNIDEDNKTTEIMDFSIILKKEEGELKIWQMRVV